MKIALIHNLPSGGAKRIVYEQIKGLAQNGHEIVEFAPSTADFAFGSLSAYVKTTRVFPFARIQFQKRRIPLLTPYIHAFEGLEYLRRMELLYQTIAEEVNGEGFDLAYVQDCQVSMKPAILGFLRTPSVFQCCHADRTQVWKTSASTQERPRDRLKTLYYSPAHAILQSKFLGDERKHIRGASRVMVLSQYARQVLLTHYGTSSQVLYPGVDSEMFSPRSVVKGNYVLCVSALEYRKGYRFLVSALAQLDSRRRPLLFIVANTIDPNEERVVREMAAQQGVSIRLESVTNNPDRLAEIYSQAAAFIYAPTREALGLAPLEALACGTPVVAVGEGGVRETLIDGLGSYVVKRDESLFAGRLQELLGDQERRAEMGKAGVEYVRQRWAWRENITRLEKHFQELLASER